MHRPQTKRRRISETKEDHHGRVHEGTQAPGTTYKAVTRLDAQTFSGFQAKGRTPSLEPPCPKLQLQNLRLHTNKSGTILLPHRGLQLHQDSAGAMQFLPGARHFRNRVYSTHKEIPKSTQ